jgi:hypothetical protein
VGAHCSCLSVLASRSSAGVFRAGAG